MNMQSPPYRWVHTTSGNSAKFTSRALRGGEDTDGSPLYICRAHYELDLIPGKVIPSRREAYVSYGGGEQRVTQIEMLTTNHPHLFEWIPGSHGSVPCNAVAGGKTETGEVLYVGRAEEQNSLTPGKIQPSLHCMFLPYGGKEKRHVFYEVLCKKDG